MRIAISLLLLGIAGGASATGAEDGLSDLTRVQIGLETADRVDEECLVFTKLALAGNDSAIGKTEQVCDRTVVLKREAVESWQSARQSLSALSEEEKSALSGKPEIWLRIQNITEILRRFEARDGAPEAAMIAAGNKG